MLAKKICLLSLIYCIAINSTFGMQPPKLHNPGATCFQNATFQVLYNIEPLTNFLVNNPNPFPANTIAHVYTQFVKTVRAQSPESTAHYPLLRTLTEYGYALVGQCSLEEGCNLLTACRQEDATEFIAKLLIELKEGGADIESIFSVGQASIVECPSIRYQRTKIDTENLINLQVAGFTTLTECLTSYFSTEELSDAYALDMTPNELIQRPDLAAYNKGLIPGCSRRIAIDHLGQIAIITLKRFTLDDSNNPIKLSHNITVEQVLNFGAFMTEHAATTNATNYELIGAIVQSGTLRSGHYIAYVKVGNQWYICNDTDIQPTNWANMIKPPEHLKGYSINQSYALCYKRGVTGTNQPITPSQPSTTQNEDLKKALTNLQVALDGLSAQLMR